MVTLRIINLDLGNSVTHDATDWQVATDPLFEDVILESKEDHENLLNISWDEVLDPTKKYYARARALLSTGYTIWGNIDVFTPYDINDVEIDIERPTLITNPIISTGYDVNNHPNSMFTIKLSNFSAISSATLESSTYIIEDLFGNILYLNENDRIHKEELYINKLVLKNNHAYRIKAFFTASSGDKSSIATKTIVVNPYTKVTLETMITDVRSNEDFNLILARDVEISKSYWELYEITDNDSVLVWSEETDSPYQVTIPAEYIKLSTKYILRYRSDIDEESNWNYEIFYVYY